MINTRWRKVLRDLWINKTRSVLIVATIAIGIFAVGTVQQLQTVILGEMRQLYEQSAAAQATLFTAGVDDDMIDTIAKMSEISGAEGRSSVSLQVQLDDGQWQTFNAVSVKDFEDIQVNKITPVYSIDDHPEAQAKLTQWPEKDQIIIERGSVGSSDLLPSAVAVGDSIKLQSPTGKDREVDISGFVYDPNGLPSAFIGAASGYVTPETMLRLGGPELYTQVLIRVNGTPEQLADKDYITSIANKVNDKIESTGIDVARVEVPDVGELPLQSLFDSLGLLLTPLGVLALFLSAFLVINTISAFMAQQVRQIGVMKAIGARRPQIIILYLGAVLVYSAISLAIAIPLTILVSGGLTTFLGKFIDITFPPFALPLNVLLLELVVGILVPLLAALYPVIKGTGITVREAVSDSGGGAVNNNARLAHFLARLRIFSRPLQLSLRNTFRKRTRLVITLITLVMGGMIFMTVGSVRASLENLINKGLAYYQFDIQIEFEDPERVSKVQQVASQVDGVSVVETWGGTRAIPILSDGTEGDPITLTALDANSVMVDPTMDTGRWLLKEDQNAIVITQNVVANQPDLGVGDTMTLKIDGKETPWVIVGVAQVLGGPPNVIPAYVEYDYFSRSTDRVGRATSVQIKMTPDAGISQDEMASRIQERLELSGIDVRNVFTIDTLRRLTGGFFDIIVYLLLAMGVLIASVGALGLMSAMSTNVLERTREIGIMRAIGASDGAVLRIVVVEGVIIGLISWVIGASLAYPVGLALSTAVGNVLFSTDLPYLFSFTGVATWFAIVAALAGIASFLPAWNASRLTVREVLSYE